MCYLVPSYIVTTCIETDESVCFFRIMCFAQYNALPIIWLQIYFRVRTSYAAGTEYIISECFRLNTFWEFCLWTRLIFLFILCFNFIFFSFCHSKFIILRLYTYQYNVIFHRNALLLLGHYRFNSFFRSVIILPVGKSLRFLFFTEHLVYVPEKIFSE